MRFSWLILLFYCTYLFLVLLKIEQVVFYMKPFLIPSLLLLLVGDLSLSENKPLLFALFFSTLGDILLMFKGEPFFILGLISFLLAHLVYILIFKGLLKSFKLNGFVVLTTAFIVTYFMVFVSYLWPFLGEMRLPVLFYAFVISAMFWFSIQFYKNRTSYKWYIIFGAMLFVISDSILSVQLFRGAFTHAHFYVMLTYLLAQFLIVKGVLNTRHEIVKI